MTHLKTLKKFKLSELSPRTSIYDKLTYWTGLGTWRRLEKTSIPLTKHINELLDDPDTDLIIERRCSVVLGDIRLWVCNFPYSYGNFYQHSFDSADLSKLTPNTPEWKQLSSFIDKQSHFNQVFGSALPNRRTVFRLWQVVESAKVALANQSEQKNDFDA